jgi:hypothetical protein
VAVAKKKNCLNMLDLLGIQNAKRGRVGTEPAREP